MSTKSCKALLKKEIEMYSKFIVLGTIDDADIDVISKVGNHCFDCKECSTEIEKEVKAFKTLDIIKTNTHKILSDNAKKRTVPTTISDIIKRTLEELKNYSIQIYKEDGVMKYQKYPLTAFGTRAGSKDTSLKDTAVNFYMSYKNTFQLKLDVPLPNTQKVFLKNEDGQIFEGRKIVDKSYTILDFGNIPECDEYLVEISD